MRVVINAMTIPPGGGMTVICGLLQSLREAAPDWTLIVLTSYEHTHHAVTNAGCADRIERILPGGSAARLFLWQNTGFGRWLRRNQIDAVITVNHFLYNIPCPQIVYHLNLLRFLKQQPGRFGICTFADWLRDFSARSAIAQASANVFESRYLQDAAESVCRGPARNGSVIYIGLPDKLIKLADRESTASPDSRRIVCITSPAEHKDNPTLIRMLAELVTRDSAENWHLDFAGGINHDVWMPLIQLARNLNVEDRITWHGFCNQDDLTRLLDGALCLVSTSRVESFAMVALEAMARQCPPDCRGLCVHAGKYWRRRIAGNAW